ncbi:MAG: hypothetical protein ACLFPQ_03630 [Candidatus Woesearchaeota archaeon]
MKIKKNLIVQSIIIILLIIALIIFDLSLNLGKFSGLVFSLYLSYASILIFIINGITSMVYFFRKKNEKSKSFFLVGLILGIIGILVAYIGGRLF